MATGVKKNQSGPFWGPVWDRLKQAVGLTPSVAQRLIKEFQELDLSRPLSEQRPCLERVVTYLTDHSNPKLTNLLRTRFNALLPPNQTAVVESLIELSLTSGRLKMLEVLEKIVSLDWLKRFSPLNPIELANLESPTIPHHVRKEVEQIKNSQPQRWEYVISGFVIQFLNYAYRIEASLVSSVMKKFHFIVDTSPKSLSEAHKTIQLFRILIKCSSLAFTTFLAFRSYRQTFALITAGLVAWLIFSKFIAHRFLFTAFPESIDPQHFFLNLTQQEKPFNQDKIDERARIIKRYFSTLTPGSRSYPYILIGKQECGATKLIKNLACCGGRTLFTTKALFFDEMDWAYQDQIFRDLQGYESQIIFHIDARVLQDNNTDHLKRFVKEANRRNIWCLLTVTSETYQYQSWLQRSPSLRLKNPSPQELKIQIKQKVSTDTRALVEVDTAIFNPLLESPTPEITHPYAYVAQIERILNFFHNYQPNLLQTLDEWKAKKKNLKQRSNEALTNDPNWSTSSDGTTRLSALQEAKDRIKELKQQFTTQGNLLDKMVRLRKLQPLFLQRYYEAMERLVHSDPLHPNEADQINFLFIKFLVRPAVQKTLNATIDELNITAQPPILRSLSLDLSSLPSSDNLSDLTSFDSPI